MVLYDASGKAIGGEAGGSKPGQVAVENKELTEFLRARGIDPNSLDTSKGVVTLAEDDKGMPNKRAADIPCSDEEGISRYLVLSDTGDNSTFAMFLPQLLDRLSYDAIFVVGNLQGHDGNSITTLVHTLATNPTSKPVYVMPGPSEGVDEWNEAISRIAEREGNLFDMTKHYARVNANGHRFIFMPGAVPSVFHKGGFFVFDKLEKSFTDKDKRRLISLGEYFDALDYRDFERNIIVCYDAPRFGDKDKTKKDAVDYREVAYVCKQGVAGTFEEIDEKDRDGPHAKEYGLHMESKGRRVIYRFENNGNEALGEQFRKGLVRHAIVSGNPEKGLRSCDHNGNAVENGAWTKSRVYCCSRPSIGNGMVSLVEVRADEKENIETRVSTHHAMSALF